MAKTDASGDKLWINRAGTFYSIKGQSNLNQPNSRSTIETSDKDSYPDKTYQVTERDRSVTLTIKPDYPDVNGIQWMETLYNSGAAELYQIRNAAATVMFAQSMVISNFTKTFNKGELRSIDITLMPAAAATVDALA